MKKIGYMFFIVLFILFISYSYPLFNYLIGNSYDEINSDTFKFNFENNRFVLFKDKLLNIRNYINSKTKYSYKPSGGKNELGYYFDDKKGVVQLSNYQKENIGEYVEIYKEFNNFLREKDIDFIYMEGFQKNHFEKDLLVKYGLKYDQKSYDKFYSKMRKNNINLIDTKEVIKEIDNKYEGNFYKTDYHWTTETAMNMSRYLGNYINNKFNYNLDLNILNDNNFYAKKYSNHYKGYYARIFGITSQYYDDFYYYLYKNELNKNSKFLYKDDTIVKRGSLNNTLFNDVIDIPTYDNEIMYDRYANGTKAHKEILNYNSNNEKKLLAIVDSQFFAMTPYISLLFKNVNIIDIRDGYGGYNESVKEYINKYSPDLVLYFTTTFDINDCKKILK